MIEQQWLKQLTAGKHNTVDAALNPCFPSMYCSRLCRRGGTAFGISCEQFWGWNGQASDQTGSQGAGDQQKQRARAVHGRLRDASGDALSALAALISYQQAGCSSAFCR